MTCSAEHWCSVRGYEDHYEVSSWGRVRSLTVRVRNKQGLRTLPGRVLKQRKNSSGYWTVGLCVALKRKTVTVSSLMGAAFLDVPLGGKTDHRNRDRGDNALGNLRPATTSQNGANAGARAGTSKYKGVSWFRLRNKWRVVVCVDGRQRHVGYFTDEVSAAKAYDRAALTYFGAYALCNFEEELLA